MVLTESELIKSLQKEVRILLHLATKIDRDKLDYRPTTKQRSTFDLLKYLSIMGPAFVRDAKAGGFDRVSWNAAKETAETRTFDETLAVIGAQSDQFASLIGDMNEADFRVEIEMFGRKSTRGFFIVNTVLCGYAAYRTQLFVYLKACGREELTTANLWSGIDPAPAA